MSTTHAGAIVARIVAANEAHAADVAARPAAAPEPDPVDHLAAARARRLAAETAADLDERRAASLAAVRDRLGVIGSVPA